MTIGINAAAAVRQRRTGVEEYCYQLIKHLTMLRQSREHRFLLYLPKFPAPPQLRRGQGEVVFNLNQHPTPALPSDEGREHALFDFPFSNNFKAKQLNWPLPMWTQIRLASEMLLNRPDVLFIPAHILPLAHPKNSIVAIHGLEYEYYPKMYPCRHLKYLRWSTKYAVKNARKIIAVSENTKRDLIKFYGARPEMISVIHHGYCLNGASAAGGRAVEGCNNVDSSTLRPGRIAQSIKSPYLLYIGRVELKKNILGILEAYKILKEKYKIPHELVLAGGPGYGYESLELKVETLRLRSGYNILEPGYISDTDKWELLAGADVFLFPSFYEGFGIPVLEAQSMGVPVVSSNISSIPEITEDSALLINPKNSEEIAEAVYKIIDDKNLHDRLIELGYKNVKRFSWEKCARETLCVLLSD
ncbi:MAG: glycosyltransferase family 4 protein [Candidatus Portnoybacteria bacterium]|nr:glycosyltransferase family 4 protein [Candidatus Portnoybacteria bacterium]